MDREEIHQYVTEGVVRIVPDTTGPVGETAAFEADLGMDSIHMIELVSHLEKTLGISIPDSDADAVGTVSELVALVGECLVPARQPAGRAAD